MSKTFVRPLAAAAVASFAIAGSVVGWGAGQASAHGDHDGDHDGYDVTIPLTERVSDELTDGANGIAATGAATKDVHDGQVVLSFPVKGGDERSHARTGDHGDHAWRLAGGIAFTGAGPDVTWSGLKVGGERGVVSALVGGDRIAVLRFADRDGHHRNGDHGDHDGAWLELTAAGAASLNKAADGSPFEAGDAFAGYKDCGR